MNKKENLSIISSLSKANGAPGFEDEVVKIISSYTNALGKTYEDKMRNFYVHRSSNNGNRPLVLLDAHMDEVALMVQNILPNGTLKFLSLGIWNDFALPAQKMRVRNAIGEYISGIVVTRPSHFDSEYERNLFPSSDNMVIDIGAVSKQDAEKNYNIRIGEPIVPDVNFEYIENNDIMIGKAFDCRLGCAALISTMNQLKNSNLSIDIVAAFSTQEEVGRRGAIVTGNNINPDVAIVFEGAPADDTFAQPYMAQTLLKKGPMLRHIDAKMITHPRFQRYALDIANNKSIPVQESVRSGGSTNGAPIHLSAKGVPVIVIGLPVRYIHSHHGISSYYDFKNGVLLACEIIRNLDSKIINSF